MNVDLAAERGLLACLCSHGEGVYWDVCGLITSGSFSLPSNQVIFACLEKILGGGNNFKGKVDFPTLLSAASSLGLSEFFAKKDEASHLRAVLNMPVDPNSWARFALKLKNLEIVRELANRLDRGKEALLHEVTGEEPLSQILNKAESPLFEYTSSLSSNAGLDGNDRGVIRLGDKAEKYYRSLMEQPRNQIGIPTGLREWDRAIGGGLRGNSMPVVAARFKGGKSFFVDNVCVNVARQDFPVLNLDTEMSEEEHLCRVGALLTGTPITDIERGLPSMSGGEKDRLLEAAKVLKEMPYFYKCVTGEPVEETAAHIRRWVKRHVGFGEDGSANPCVVVYDYLKLMDYSSLSRSGLSEHQMLGYVTAALKDLAKRYGLCVLAMAQMNRDGISKEDTSVLAQADRIGWFSTSVTLLKQKEQEEIDEEAEAIGVQEARKHTHKLVPLVSRHGPGVRKGDYINLVCDFSRAVIKEGPMHSQVMAGAGAKKKGFVGDRF